MWNDAKKNLKKGIFQRDRDTNFLFYFGKGKQIELNCAKLQYILGTSNH